MLMLLYTMFNIELIVVEMHQTTKSKLLAV